MSQIWLLFSFHGRIGRAQFWGANVAIGFSLTIILSIVFAGMQASFFAALTDSYVDPLTGRGGMMDQVEAMTLHAIIVVGPILFVCLWIISAVAVKRLHDRDRPAWWFVAYCGVCWMPYIGLLAMIWYFIELGCLPGTEGANRYDAEPGARKYSEDAGKTADWAENLDIVALAKQSPANADYQPRVLKKRKPAVERVSRVPDGFGRRGRSA